MRESIMHLLRPNRRELLKMSAGSLFAAGLWPGALVAEGESSGKEFSFIVVNDTHYIDKECDAWITKVLKQMKAQTPAVDFCLLVGDVVDSGTTDQMVAMRGHMKHSGLEFHLVPGNHDYWNDYSRKAYEEQFPKSTNYQFERHGWQFIGFDSCEGAKYDGTKILPENLKWLDEQLPKLDKKRPTVLFTHFPLSPKGKSDKVRPLNADDLLERFKEYNLRAVFNGHYHWFQETQVQEVAITTNWCCASRTVNVELKPTKGYFLCHAKDGKIERSYVEVKPS
jgi:3',5'-cyclic AMP phosphodiesterase CpdA